MGGARSQLVPEMFLESHLGLLGRATVEMWSHVGRPDWWRAVIQFPSALFADCRDRLLQPW